ncbi:hypothetical protein GA707_09790 [Nostocoides sp. F2B08]|uniref:O-antigen ligase family protein n=1 Tax=Nostocoides sp. F2B08 TaxID=2653936 RepID=UPI001262D4FE|nr:O-antigen ligase family protein [Tetrasphaera sp. F2B08]KAB7744848.1 hypothetical protein GA707_09790 [Tetrasphaera sp. F2B08]
MTTKGAAALAAVIATWVVYALLSGWWFDSSLRGVAPYVYAPVLIVVGGVGGWGLGRASPRVAGVVTVALATLFLVGVLSSGAPAKGPIGYANANAAVAVQLIALSGLVAMRSRAGRWAWPALAISVLTVVANRSAAAMAVAAPLVATVALAARFSPGRRRWPAAGLAVATLAATAVGLVALARRVVWPTIALEAFDEVRQLLWLQAWGAFRDAEVAGRGPGFFEALNLLKDPDQSSAHSLPLQVAVELGGIGLALLILLYLAGLGVAVNAATPARSWIAVAAWTALAVHSFVDHLLEYWPIPLAAGLVLGYGLVAQPDAEPQDEVI